AFAEYDLAPASAVVTLPETLAELPFPGEALGCAMNVFRRCEIRTGDRVAVVGVGFLGALLVQLAVRAGAHVVAFSRRTTALEVGWAMGAAGVVPLEPEPGRASAHEPFDVVIEAA